MISALSAGTEDSHGDPWVPHARLPRVAELATIPLTLEAASYLELVPSLDDAWADWMELASKAWRVSIDQPTLDVLLQWWKQFLDLRTAPAVTLKALDRMLL